ncbi:hypothetical protein RMN57_13135 [Kitasatospora sp. CM 4170]|uniref:Integral membrane protein n=1 Tax=Kitasatospora aburaviensis TaxID=67265 RepID=A0ABW1F3X1_9ACTN|nr:hypothetical protein [Kitasatospora sp. CM 4170]WNM45598.1 hypothetical protein RMN57_13135 [Kitasatospora sp. CM 4170]
MNYLATAIDTAAQYQLAAPEKAPGLEVSGPQGGALIIGIVIAAVLITRWKSGKLGDSEKKTLIWAVVMTICLYGGSGIIGSLFNQVKTTADQTGTTITQTGVGTGGGTVTR